ncbi:MAG: hypothetical protein GOMPHAMPRED_001779 [Gomphillus americanus]|uniref:Fumarylacetoacetase n=1 Tax=Gomphillus americanus TaxID=1940652 RepID=A0A8H3F9B8_9LECA|nr:MAG: hypothetical protein GOMPHAMPRED_001779 [Gomphillus americanus]
MAVKSWLSIAPDSDFSLANLPFGIISTSINRSPRPAVAIGNYAFDLATFSMEGSFDRELSVNAIVFQQTTLNAFAAMGRPFHRKVRQYLQSILAEDTSHIFKSDKSLQERILIPLSDVENHLPMDIGDYTDFFAGRNHAFNAGVLFRGPQNALQPNYHHLPVAYHGRSSSIVVSGTKINRPRGQALVDPKAEVKFPEFRPCKVLDFELELGMFLCQGNQMGSPIDVKAAQDHIFGYVLLNDWSARDIQAWEYVPLGPFTAKNFATTISPWVVLADAMEPFGAAGIVNDIEVQSYLRENKSDWALDIMLEVDLTLSDGTTSTITKTNARNLMWSFPQMIAHHTITGCPLRPGDLFGSGTISGTEQGSLGSLLEMTQGGKQSFKLADGKERKYLQDGDSVSLRGRAGKTGAYVGFGKCTGTILPAHS